jgi:hypothetical protein
MPAGCNDGLPRRSLPSARPGPGRSRASRTRTRRAADPARPRPPRLRVGATRVPPARPAAEMTTSRGREQMAAPPGCRRQGRPRVPRPAHRHQVHEGHLRLIKLARRGRQAVEIEIGGGPPATARREQRSGPPGSLGEDHRESRADPEGHPYAHGLAEHARDGRRPGVFRMISVRLPGTAAVPIPPR